MFNPHRVFGSLFLFIPLLGLTLVSGVVGQDSNSWDVTVPRGNTREVEFTTREGTWMGNGLSLICWAMSIAWGPAVETPRRLHKRVALQ